LRNRLRQVRGSLHDIDRGHRLTMTRFTIGRMTHFFAFKPLPLAAIALATAALSAPPGPSDEDAIRTVEHQWVDAEYHADTATLKKLLLPEYRTVSENGVHDRDRLIAGVLKRGGRTVEPPYSTWPTPKIEIHGSTALATFAVADSSYSVDVFVFENGGWHAMYSQHTVMKTVH
jgi:hypothetical protein